MKKIFALLSLCALVAMSGCTKNQVGCAVEGLVTAGVAPVVATQLQCTNTAAIQADLATVIGKVGLCTTAPAAKLTLSASGIVSPALCDFFGNLVVSQLAAQAIPAAWGCTAVNAQAKLNTVISQACAKL